MLFSCAPAGGHDHTPKTAVRAKRGGRPFTVDIHCHVVTPAADELMRDQFSPEKEPALHFASADSNEVNRKQFADIRPQITTPELRLAAMDRMGIDIQAISPAPTQYYYWAEPERGRETCRLINDRVAEIVAGRPDRFVGMGTVPMQHPESAVAELERAVRRLGLRGIEIGGNIAGEEISNPRFRPFFARAEELGVLLFLHPMGFTEGRRLTEHYFNNVIGNPLESTVAVSHLIFDGVLDRHPGLKLCIAHGGGYLAAYSARMDHAHAARPDCSRHIAHPPTSYLRRLYFDTMVFAPDQLAYLVAKYGADHVLLGTDYPYDMGEDDPVGLVARTPGLKAADRAAICGGNAARLLGIEIPAAARSG